MDNFEESFQNQLQEQIAVEKQKPKHDHKMIILAIVGVFAVILAIVSVFFKMPPKPRNEAEKSARIFFNYLLVGRETDKALPKYSEEATYFIENVIAQNNKETTLNYIKHAIELYDNFSDNVDFGDFDELNADYAREQYYDLEFLKFITETPPPSLDEIVKTDDLDRDDFMKYLNSSDGESFGAKLPWSAEAYIEKLRELKSDTANSFADDYMTSTYYDLLEAAIKLQSGCTKYNCDYEVNLSDDEDLAELVNESYEDMINAPQITAAKIAASSYDIIEEFNK